MKKIANKSLCWALVCAMVLTWLLFPMPLQAEAVSKTFAGSPDDYYLVGYINGADYGCQEDYQNLGSYKFVDGKLTATFTQDSYVFVKNGDNSKWLLADSYCTDTTCTFSEGKSEKMFVPGGVELTFTLVENGDGSLILSYTVPNKVCQHPSHNDDGICADCGVVVEHTFVGGVCTICGLEDMPALVSDYYVSGSFNGWALADTAYKMNWVDDRYVLEVILPAGDNYFKVNDGTWDNAWPSSNYAVYVSVDCTITIFFNPTTEEITITGCNVSVINIVDRVEQEGLITADALELFYEDGEYEYYFPSIRSSLVYAEYSDGTQKPIKEALETGDVTIADLDRFGIKYYKESVTKEPTVPVPGNPSEEIVEYYLYGFINGFDVYGSEYVFVNGSLIVTFDADSYIYIGTNRDITYMTEVYITETSATFIVGGAEKMFVPGGVELTFSLTENANGSITVSYTVLGETCQHPSHNDDGICTDCGVAIEHTFKGGICTICGLEDMPVLVSDFYVSGSFNGWVLAGADYKMTWADGRYVLKVALPAGDNYFKVNDGTWDNAWPTNNYSVYVGLDCTITIFFDPATEQVTIAGYNVESTPEIIIPTLTLKAPTLEFKDMITVNALFTAENLDSVIEMGMITYKEQVTEWSVETAAHVIPGTTYDVNTGCYIACSQGIHAKYLSDTVYLACYAKLTDGTYTYSKLASYSPLQYATNQLKNTNADAKLKQLVVAMLNYSAAAQTYFGHNVENLANAALTAEQIALQESYRSDMVSTVASASTEKQGAFVNNKGFTKRYPSISFEGAFCINYFFTPNYAPVDGITLYYWNAADFEAVDVLTVENASGSFKLEGEGTGEYRGDIVGIAAKNLSEAVYVAAVYSDGNTTWTSGVLGYSIGAYCASQSTKGGTIADLVMATAVYGYHAKQYFG